MMTSQYPQTLTPKMVDGITGFRLCAYLMGLEGWRRGLVLKYYGDINKYSKIRTQGKKIIGRNYSLESENEIHYFNQSRGDIVSNEAVRVAQNKQTTKEYLNKYGVYTLPSKEFTKHDTDEEIIKATHEIVYPVIVKPTYGTLSKGVVLNIKNEYELADALNYVRNKLGFKNVIIERYFEGHDIRLYVVNDVTVAALKRVPAQVIGDGKSTIKELILQKNDSRENNPYLAARPIKIDNEVRKSLESNDYKLSSILESKKKILVKNKSTMDQGVDLYDITDSIQDHIKQLAIDTLKALPDIAHGSIDMLYDGNEAVVIEVNPSANISMHMFPTEGKPRNIPSYIMDFYFPETKGKALVNKYVYFDYLNIVGILTKNYTNYIEVKSLSSGPLHAMRYIVTGKIGKVGYMEWLKRQASLNNLHGYGRKLDNENVEIVVASNDTEKVKGLKKACMKGPKKAKVNNVSGSVFQGEIKFGFEIKSNKNIEDHDLTELHELKKKIETLEKKCGDLKRRESKYKKKYHAIENSKSWQITQPVRKAGALVRRISGR